MTFARIKKRFLLLLFISSAAVLPVSVYAQAIKASVSEILSNPEKFDGKIVQVRGHVDSIKFRTSKRGNPYTILTVSDASKDSINVFSFGTLSLKKGDTVIVTGRYNKMKRVPPRHTFYNEIDTSEGSVQKTNPGDNQR